MDFQELTKRFADHYKTCSEERLHIFFAPGRVNLIGEHTDYNGGYVLPCSLDFGTYMVVCKSEGRRVRFASANENATGEVDLSEVIKGIDGSWINYPLGVINEFINLGAEITGMNIFYYGDIPPGAGLSSSASIEMVTAYALNELFGAGLSMPDMIRLSQKAENEFVGNRCGIMDQFSIGMGKKDHALFLDCDTLDYRMVPIALSDYSLVIINTNKKRELTASEYNKRREECETALRYINQTHNYKNLSRLDIAKLDSYLSLIPDPVLKKRVKHVVSENERVIKTVEAFRIKDMSRIASLMHESHESLRNDYEVSSPELDLLVGLAGRAESSSGSRMTGGGFGGCTVNLVAKNRIEEFKAKIGGKYYEKTGIIPDFYLPAIGSAIKNISSPLSN